MFLAAVVQMTSTSHVEANWEQSKSLIERAASYGARLVATPENTNFLGPASEKVRTAEPTDGPTCRRYRDLAARLGIHLLLGSFNERGNVPDKCFNTSVLFGPDGRIIASYRKIHLFDVDVSEAVHYRESDQIEAGDRAIVAETPLGRLGLSICYDLRFGNLYRRLVRDGAEILCVPAAFTLTTGRAHWEPLLRAERLSVRVLYWPPLSAASTTTMACARHSAMR